MTRAQLETALVTELLEELRHERTARTEMMAHVKGLITNDLLLVVLDTFDATGIISHDFPTPYGCVHVSNHGTAAVIVSADAPQQGAPRGRGSARVDVGKGATLDLHGRALTLYGIAGEQVTIQVFSRTWPPFDSGGAGAVTVNQPATDLTFSTINGLALPSAAAETEISAAANRMRRRHDLTDCLFARLMIKLSALAGAGVMRCQYSTDESTWLPLDGGTGPEVPLSGGVANTRVSPGITITPAARADVFLRLVEINGDAVTGGVAGTISLQVGRKVMP